MLKRLELVGFKSFADKTAFDFADGVTGVVGPNGSGKSNVVDAVRWVLGEQSARSLRGGEMTDVIFNGSSSRRSLGMAEVSMTFDNRMRSLNTDAEEVRITRRVYRTGEGEYQINGQECRLKDIKDLFLGSGAGTDAYSIIQQGQVDVLLQTAPKERRVIFEEAAGISRFKAKKIEALRRLERVDANLQRLRDILEEVEKQLRSVKLQAAKAQRYQEHTARLRHLCLATALREYHQVTLSLHAERAELEQLRQALRQGEAEAEGDGQELVELEQRLAALDEAIAGHEAAFGEAREVIAKEQARLGQEWSVFERLEVELSEARGRRAGLGHEVAQLTALRDAARQERQAGEAQLGQEREALDAAETALGETEARLTALREELERENDRQWETARLAARLQNDTSAYRARLDDKAHERDRLQHRSEQAAEHLASLDTELDGLIAAEEALLAQLAAAREGQARRRGERDQLTEARDAAARHAADLRAQRSGLVSRMEVLQALERSHEGLGTGVREVFAHLEAPDPGPWRAIIGSVAEALTVRREYAPLIDLALGERAQRFLVADRALLDEALRNRRAPFSGRVSFLPLDTVAHVAARPAVPSHPDVIAPADQLVRCEDARLAGLPALLLGETLLVRDRAAALALAGNGRRCITLDGELVEPDGTLTVGAHLAESGIVSRKSELRDLREQLRELDGLAEARAAELEGLRTAIEAIEAALARAEGEIAVLADQAADMRGRVNQHRERRHGLSEQVSLSQTELGFLESEIEELTTAWEQARDAAAAAENDTAAARRQAEVLEQELRESTARQAREQQGTVAGKVRLAQTEERLEALRRRQAQLETDLGQRGGELRAAAERLRGLVARWGECQASLLAGGAALAEAHGRKEQAERRLAAQGEERAALRQRRQERAAAARARQGARAQQQEQAHAREVSVLQLEHQLEMVREPLAREHDLDLAALYAEQEREGRLDELDVPLAASRPEGDDGPALSPEDEMAELRRKLAKLGGVNLEAIDELKELELRHDALRTQFDDLTASQRTLQEIIDRINTDSRRLFTETFEAIKAHFQELFRKLFGGGMADILLEEGADVLEGGIEILARPPGKELRGISLMSGGEKTMTAVALLLAIFRSKPSPFCILDEVDAALDEANVGRFTAVLRDFLDRSQFILVTHHKRTMATADVLYGVTMKEPGVSSRYAVRFEDWPDDDRAPQAA